WEHQDLLAKIVELDLNIELRSHLNLKVDRIKFNNFSESESRDKGELLITFKSSPLFRHLKEMNIYSNNFMAQKLYDFLGGPEEFSSYLNKKFKTTKKEAYFYTGSGLGENYTTCSLTLKMLNSLWQ